MTEPPRDATPPPAPRDRPGVEDLEDLPPAEEPSAAGTLFIMLIFLMALAGLWGLMYLMLLER